MCTHLLIISTKSLVEDVNASRDVESPADASNPNLCLKDPSLTRAVTGSKTAIVAIGNADSQKLLNVRVGGWISVSVEDERDVENVAVDDVKELGAEKNLR
jgi:hypothetical protein